MFQTYNPLSLTTGTHSPPLHPSHTQGVPASLQNLAFLKGPPLLSLMCVYLNSTPRARSTTLPRHTLDISLGSLCIHHPLYAPLFVKFITYHSNCTGTLKGISYTTFQSGTFTQPLTPFITMASIASLM